MGAEMRTSLRMEDGAAWIVLDDGKVNAMSCEMLREIEQRLDEARPAGGPVVIKGRPGIFSAGFDLQTFARGPDASLRMVRAGVSLIETLLAYPRPVVTACTGHAYPMGAFLMLCADVRFGIAGPWKIGMNEVAIKLAVPQFAIELARHRLTPPGVARLATAAMFDPEAAAKLGYLDFVVDGAALDAAVLSEVERLKTLDWPSYEATKQRLNGPVRSAIAAAVAGDPPVKVPDGGLLARSASVSVGR
jgi:enoyl-CoA hydratase